jgi:hypothetical protein
VSDEDRLRQTAQMDQFMEAIKPLASIIWAYYTELLKQGFDAKQALQLTIGMQAYVMSQGGEKK